MDTDPRLAHLPEILSPAEVGQLFRVDPKTVSRWSSEGRIPSFRTPGGHRRYHRADVAKLLQTRR